MPIAARKHRSALLLLVLALTLPLAAHADDASHRAKAQQLVELLGTQKAVQQNADNLVSQVKEVGEKASGPDLTPEQKAKIAAFEKQATDVIDAQVGWKTLEPLFIDTYTKAFTEDELSGIIAFYKTPAGAAFLEKTPALNEQNARFEKTRMAALTTQWRQLVADLQKSLTPPPAPAASASTTPPASSAAPAKPSAPASSPTPATSAPK
jgi:hypothetical protein